MFCSLTVELVLTVPSCPLPFIRAGAAQNVPGFPRFRVIELTMTFRWGMSRWGEQEPQRSFAVENCDEASDGSDETDKHSKNWYYDFSPPPHHHFATPGSFVVN